MYKNYFIVLELHLKNIKIMHALLRAQTPPLRCVFVPNRSRHFRVTPRDKRVMSTCRWHGDALLAGGSRRGNGNDGYCDARPQAMRNCAEVELTCLAAN